MTVSIWMIPIVSLILCPTVNAAPITWWWDIRQLFKEIVYLGASRGGSWSLKWDKIFNFRINGEREARCVCFDQHETVSCLQFNIEMRQKQSWNWNRWNSWEKGRVGPRRKDFDDFLFSRISQHLSKIITSMEYYSVWCNICYILFILDSCVNTFWQWEFGWLKGFFARARSPRHGSSC